MLKPFLSLSISDPENKNAIPRGKGRHNSDPHMVYPASTSCIFGKDLWVIQTLMLLIYWALQTLIDRDFELEGSIVTIYHNPLI